MKRKECPYCGSENLEYYDIFALYKCLGCGNSFNEYEAQYEDIRHELSELVKDATDDKPLKCKIPISENYDNSFDVLGIYKDRYGLIRFNVCGVENEVDFSDIPFDDLGLNGVKTILQNVKNMLKT